MNNPCNTSQKSDAAEEVLLDRWFFFPLCFCTELQRSVWTEFLRELVMFPKSADQLSLSVFPEFSHYYDFDHVTRSICSPQSNRITQRAACTVQPMLSKSKTINSWLMESDLMAKSYNSSLKSQDQVFSCNKPKDKKTCSYICKGIVTKGERFVSGYTPTVQAFKKEKTTQQKQQLTYCQNRALEREKEIGS